MSPIFYLAKMSILANLVKFGDMVASYFASGSTDESTSLLSKVIGGFGSVLRANDNNKIAEPIQSNGSANWRLLLTEAAELLQKHKGLILDVQSQALRVDEDIRVLLDIAQAKIIQEGIDDREYAMERLIQLAASLPNNSETQTKLTGSFMKELWDSLQHPPLSYLGDEYKYRTADGSKNNVMHPMLGMTGMPYAKSVTPMTTGRTYPDPGEVFDKLLARRGPPKEHPNKISSTLFYMASIIIHDVFRTGNDDRSSANQDRNISSTSSYLDLSPLYGNSIAEQEAVRTMEDGMLKPDTFSEHRILGFPPGVSALLIAFNRFHNYAARELKHGNEGGRFSPNPRLSEDDAKKAMDNDLFNTARLVTCGLYVNIILFDYVKTILNMNYAPNSTWVLDPRDSSSDMFSKTAFPAGTGNQVSAEFNLIYRWHSTISLKDEKWTQDFFQELFSGRDVSDLPLRDFLVGLYTWRDGIMSQTPESRTFAGLKRDKSGYFDTLALARLIADGTRDVSAAFGAHQVPTVLKLVVILGMGEAREWHMATLNELRKFIGLKPHGSFEDINSDPEIQDAMKSLYQDPDFVEMYPGILFEQSKEPAYPGSGLCGGFTLVRSILSDAVSLIRGDRFYTLDWTPASLTDWGFDVIKPNKPQDKLARGGKMHQLLDVAFPEFYKSNSVWKLFPFTVPDEAQRIFEQQGVAAEYDFSTPL